MRHTLVSLRNRAPVLIYESAARHEEVLVALQWS